jgi:hypothetical protein
MDSSKKETYEASCAANAHRRHFIKYVSKHRDVKIDFVDPRKLYRRSLINFSP